MRLLRGLQNIPADFPGCVATIGNFDGLHRGHRQILDALKVASQQDQLPTLVMLFEPHPKEFFAGDKAPPRLANLREKLMDLRDAGVDYVLCIPFNKEFSALSTEAFIQQVLLDGVKVKHLIVGDDFRFGSGRSGDYKTLAAAGVVHGFNVDDSPTHCIYGARASSSRVRAVLGDDDLETAKTLLSRDYRMFGRVGYGRQLGRTLNAPTANVMVKRRNLAMSGVFAVRAQVHETGECFTGVANLGRKPTLGGELKPSLEVHLFGFSGDLYGKHLNTEFLHKIRDERKFDSLEALQAAIARDISDAKSYFSSISSADASGIGSD
ncbi:MAG: bifunctional riboflavin kinase/FAD synthetase [Oceanobacter sp.]